MLTLEQIQEGLMDRKANAVARAIKVRVATVIDIQKRRTMNPRYQTVKALSDYLTRDDK